jgi:hypothetical protein
MMLGTQIDYAPSYFGEPRAYFQSFSGVSGVASPSGLAVSP